MRNETVSTIELQVVVTDSNKNAIPYATIELENLKESTTQTFACDSLGVLNTNIPKAAYFIYIISPKYSGYDEVIFPKKIKNAEVTLNVMLTKHSELSPKMSTIKSTTVMGACVVEEEIINLPHPSGHPMDLIKNMFPNEVGTKLGQ